MLDDNSEIIQQEMLKTEAELIDAISEASLDGLIDIFHRVSNETLDTAELIEDLLSVDREYTKEAVFSTFRVLKAVLAEIEYRIKENKI